MRLLLTLSLLLTLAHTAAGQEAETAGQEAEVAGRGPEVAGQGPEVAGQGPEVAGQGPEIAGQGPEIDAIETLLGRLVEEARATQMQLEPPPAEPDAKRRIDLVIDAATVGSVITRRLHTDPFVDAFVRWQLTSYEPPLGPFDDDRFSRFVRESPPLLDNPWAGFRLGRFVGHLAEQGPLTTQERELVQLRLDDTRRQAELVHRFDHVASSFRRWVDVALADRPPRRLAWRLEAVAARIRAGWPAADETRRVDELLATFEPGSTLDEPTRAWLLASIERLAAIERRVVDSATLCDDGSLEASIRPIRVDPPALERWTRTIAAMR